MCVHWCELYISVFYASSFIDEIVYCAIYDSSFNWCDSILVWLMLARFIGVKGIFMFFSSHPLVWIVYLCFFLLIR